MNQARWYSIARRQFTDAKNLHTRQVGFLKELDTAVLLSAMALGSSRTTSTRQFPETYSTIWRALVHKEIRAETMVPTRVSAAAAKSPKYKSKNVCAGSPSPALFQTGPFSP